MSGVEAVTYNRCRASTWVAGVVDGTVFSFIAWSILGRVQVPRTRAVRAAISILPTALAAVIYARPNVCRLQLAQRLDSPLAADVRTVLRQRYPGNELTGAIDAENKDQPEKDRESGTGLPLLWDLKVADVQSAGSVRRSGEELGAAREQDSADVMMTEDEPNASFAARTAAQPPRQATQSSASARQSPSTTPSPSSASQPSASSPLPRSRTLSTTAREDSPFSDDEPHIRLSPEEQRHMRREEQEQVRKQRDDERRQRMEQRVRTDGAIQTDSSSVGGKRRFVKRNEFGDEVFDDTVR